MNKNIFELFVFVIIPFRIFALMISVKKLKINGFIKILGNIKVRGYNGIVTLNKNCIIRNITIVFDDNNNCGKLIIGKNVKIEDNVVLSVRGGNIEIEDNVYIGANCVIQSYKNSNIKIGKNTMIARNTSLFSTNHDVKNPLNGYSSESEGNIFILNNVWIGANSTVLANTIINEYSVIAASSVVSRDVPSFSILIDSNNVIKKYSKKNKKWVNIND